jgi:hypothetical protein
MIESHTKEELMKLSNAELKKLHGEYSGKDDEKSQDEANVIKGILDERGDTVKEQNEELLMILDVLCEMVGVDMETLVEETRKEMENMAKAHEWDKPAPEGEDAASDRLARVRENMKRLGKRNTRGVIPAGPRTAAKIEGSGEKNIHEPTAAARLGGAPPVTHDPEASARIENSILKIGDEVSERAIADEIGKKPKSKGKK